MKISDLLSPTDVMFDIRGSNKRLLLQELAAKAAAGLGLPADQVASWLLKREELGSTGIGKGVAVPHARLPELQRPYGLLAKLKQGIEFDAIDGQAVDIVFVLLLPAAAENEALGALALVARTIAIAGELSLDCGLRKIHPSFIRRSPDRSESHRQSAQRIPEREPSASAKIIFPQPGEVSWHENIRKRHPPRSSAR